MPAYHDLGYRSLFAHPELVRELVTHFTPFTLFDDVALSCFEPVDPVYVSERMAARQNDIVWRVRIGEQTLYVYILLEFQSGVDRWMALRMQNYVGLLCQNLIKQHQLPPSLLLPPVLPLVFYNGVPRWSASTDLATLLMEAPAELAPFQPFQRYVLIDQQRMDRAVLEANSTLLALLFRLELSSASEVKNMIFPALLTWFNDTPQESLRRSVAQWINHLAQRRGEPESFALDSVEKGADMERKFATWAEEFEDIGFQKGLALAEKARAEGLEKGAAEGKLEGRVSALRSVLGTLLHKRFGDLPQTATQRIGQATQAELEQWVERSLDAPGLAAVFGDDPAPA
ncbi:Rpn family recombination-promoting nuclease/putative transposase [Massilia aquatica]|uniref:Rpn family recombination-promoting nuclease/putative transposase n=1 Tax=Massilia aquatica TaxID=2609000 RepID=A0ABX0M7Z5_9BURK|nr:Rpn family recombination-promoting nuclease/putative transposase [Massilia aquatica]NHZ43331.1 Rpn family recombination-promoting nuclease/putative transposase [Massilia aquatica]